MRQLKISKSVTQRTEVIEKYMRDIVNFSMVSPEEETDLAMKIKNGDEEALNKLVEANLRFVISVAKQYQNMGLTLSDLINEGNIGLIKAAKLFDPTRGMKFITYAVWWIRQQILQAVSQNGRTVRIPVNKSGLASKICKMYDTLEQKLQREPSCEEVAKEMGITADVIQSAISNSAKALSLDMPTGEDNDVCMLDFLPDNSAQLADSHVEKESLNIDLDLVLAILSDREKNIIKMFYGIGEKEHSLDDIACKTNLSTERIRQIKDKAIRKLKQSATTKILIQYL